MPSFYGSDLAYIHHVGYRTVPEAAARWLGRYLALHAVPPGCIVDLGCGSGVFASAVGGAGRAVIGIDASAAMVSLARRTAPAARFRTGSLHTAKLPECAIVTMIGEGLSYVPRDGRIPPLAATFRRIADPLLEGGLLVFDVITGPIAELVPRSGFRTGPDWAVLSETRALRSRNRFARHVTVFRRVDGHYRRSEEVHEVQVHDRRRVAEALRGAGFTVRTTKAYDRRSLLPGRTVFVARKRSDRAAR